MWRRRIKVFKNELSPKGLIGNHVHSFRPQSQVSAIVSCLSAQKLISCSMQFSLSRARSINLREVENDKQLQHYVEEWVGVFY